MAKININRAEYHLSIERVSVVPTVDLINQKFPEELLVFELKLTWHNSKTKSRSILSLLQKIFSSCSNWNLQKSLYFPNLSNRIINLRTFSGSSSPVGNSVLELRLTPTAVADSPILAMILVLFTLFYDKDNLIFLLAIFKIFKICWKWTVFKPL